MERAGRAGIRAVTAGTADLQRMLRRDRRPRLLAAALLIAPLFVFSLINFVVPVCMILFQSVDDTAIGTVLVRTLPAIAAWDGTGTPDVIHNSADALASAAAFLKGHGWQPGQGWNEGEPNFQAILGWNSATIYAKTVALFAEKLAEK